MNYYVIFTTGKDAFAGTDANVYFEVLGTKGKSSIQKIADYKKEKFERGSKDEFKVRDKAKIIKF